MSDNYAFYKFDKPIRQKKIIKRGNTILTINNDDFNSGRGSFKLKLHIKSNYCKCEGGSLTVKTDIAEDIYKLLRVFRLANKGKAKLSLPYGKTLTIKSTKVDDGYIIKFKKTEVSSSGGTKYELQMLVHEDEMVEINRILAYAIGIDKK